MALPSFADDVITVYRAPYKEERGTKIRDWKNATPHTVTGCSVQMRETSTSYDAREAVTVRAVVYMPPNADIEAHDKVVFDGIAYSIDGAPFLLKSPAGRVSHKKMSLIDWRG